MNLFIHLAYIFALYVLIAAMSEIRWQRRMKEQWESTSNQWSEVAKRMNFGA